MMFFGLFGEVVGIIGILEVFGFDVSNYKSKVIVLCNLKFFKDYEEGYKV